MLRAIERATRQVIEPMNLPTVDAVNSLRIAKFKQRVVETVVQSDAKELRPIVEQLEAESGLPLIDIAAALAAFSCTGVVSIASASSHREAPAISRDPAADNTDLWAWVTPGAHDKLNIVASYTQFSALYRRFGSAA